MTRENEPTVRVLVVDDQRLMRDGIASLLRIQENIEVVGQAANGLEALEQANLLLPDVILMDVRMPKMDGVTATAKLRGLLPTCKILMLTTFDDEEYVLEALKAGASGYLLKDIPVQDLAQAVQAVHKGIYQLDPGVASKLLANLAGTNKRPDPPPLLGDITGREREVLRLVAQGATNREIAEKLVISEGTVKNHISNILGRLGLRDRTQAAIFARENNLL